MSPNQKGAAMARTDEFKLLSATLLVCAGALRFTIGYFEPRNPGTILGLALLLVGTPMLIRQWTGRGVMAHAAGAVLWLFGTEPAPGRDRAASAPGPAE